MSQFCLIAEIQANEGKSDAITAQLKILVEASRKEEGCIAYELYRDETKADLFIMREIWASEQVLEQHQQTAHFQNFVAVAEKEALMKSLVARPLTLLV
ncbi:putative quinol monooxygenase [Vibrio quintilis]|uniref:Putative monooxygenase YcnE n=1 Tax=Vibrio quintilis TaxID=1117707 RepID=A0A1M7YX46_9VIBR|nr:putative quinol monooxygenase [Vibrio quintilis]SHO57066.1 Putative monooxygenase YcnE [Vibrio quintilis]